MNEVYNLIIGGAIDPLEKIIMVVLFFIMFESLIGLMVALVKMGGK